MGNGAFFISLKRARMKALGNKRQAADCAEAGNQRMNQRFLHGKRYNYLVNKLNLPKLRLEELPQSGTLCRSKAMPWIRAR